jgi:hypothetical protein
MFAAPEILRPGDRLRGQVRSYSRDLQLLMYSISPTHNPFAAIRFSEQIASQGSASRTPSFCQLATYLKKILLFQ